MIDINDPKIRWAQHMANVMEVQQCTVTNYLGGVDIKPAKHVVIIHNPDLLDIITPYYDPLSNSRKSDNCWMVRDDYLTFHKSEKH